MNTLNLFVASVGATAFMSSYMYLISQYQGKAMRIPYLLGSLFSPRTRTLGEIDFTPPSRCVGTAVHYATGFVFMMVYAFVWSMGWLKANIFGAAALGVLHGFAGCGIWSLVFKFFPVLTKMNVRQFFIHLFIAHLIFAAVATMIVAAWFPYTSI